MGVLRCWGRPLLKGPHVLNTSVVFACVLTEKLGFPCFLTNQVHRIGDIEVTNGSNLCGHNGDILLRWHLSLTTVVTSYWGDTCHWSLWWWHPLPCLCSAQENWTEFSALQLWLLKKTLSRDDPFMDLLLSTDVLPCLCFENKEVNWLCVCVL